MDYEIGRVSRTGNREDNQDRLAALETEHGVLLALADGMGGQHGGALAAQTLIDTVSAELAHYALPVPQPQQFLTQLLTRAHQAVHAAGRAAQPPLDPGTTAVLCLIQNGTATWAHVGDSRLYLFRKDVALYRTRDHSYVEELYRAGKLTLARRQGHPMRNYVTQCVGLQRSIPKFSLSREVALEPGDVLLLCSDGLWEPLDDAQLGTLLAEGDLDQSLNRLGERAEEASWPRSDNISALAIRIRRLAEPADLEAAEAAERSGQDRLSDAIEEIERTLRQYEHEMKN